MKQRGPTATSIDEYIAGFPPAVQERLQTMRATIRAQAPDAVEAIKYAIPTFVLGRVNLVHFAAYGGHVGFYPAPSGTAQFAARLAPYAHGKGSVQFPHEEPLPLDLVAEIVAFRVQETRERVASPRKA